MCVSLADRPTDAVGPKVEGADADAVWVQVRRKFHDVPTVVHYHNKKVP